MRCVAFALSVVVCFCGFVSGQDAGGIVIRTLNVQLDEIDEHFVLRIGW